MKMFLLENAMKNLKRNWGRNLLLAIVLLSIIVMSGISIILHTSSTIMMEDYKNRFGSKVLLTLNDPSQTGRIDPKQLMEFGDSHVLQSRQYTAKVVFTSTSFKAVDQQNPNIDPKDPDHLFPQGYLIGSSSKEINTDFQNGIKKIVSGTMFQKEQEVIISKLLADTNHLKAGDTVILNSTSLQEPLTVSLTISGIYEDVSIGQKMTGMAMNHPANEIYGSFQTVTNTSLYKSRGILDACFYLKDPAKLSEFQQELKEKGLPDYFMVSTDEVSYRKMIKPIEDVKKLSTLFTLGTLSIGSLILMLLSIYAIRERKYEIGVLRAMGMKKTQAAFGFISEIFIITNLCLIIGLGIASQGGRLLGDSLLAQQKEIAFQLGVEDPMTDIQAGLTMPSAVQIICVTIFLGLISGAAGIFIITRYEPRKILSDGT